MFCALHKFRYEDKFIHMIKVAFTNIESKIKMDSYLTLQPLC